MKTLTEIQSKLWHNRTNDTLESVAIERRKQLEKWGIQSHNSEIWLAILTEEVGELAERILDSKRSMIGNPADARALVIHEARQVAAVAVAICQCIAYGEA